MSKTSLFIYDVSDNLPEVCTVGGKAMDLKCPKCGSYMVEKGNKLVCSQETCGYVEAKDEKE